MTCYILNFTEDKKMKLRKLIEALQEILDECDDDAPVLISLEETASSGAKKILKVSHSDLPHPSRVWIEI